MREIRFAVAAFITAVGAPPVQSATPPAANCSAHAPEAAARSGIAVDIILRVMRAESGGSPSVVSIKGAIGCMQIMPATWTYLSQRYGLGGDPYDARMNMIGGAMYLAELARRFGWPGAYAAYNAGPARYIRYAANGIPLPAETVAYVARLGGAAAPAIAAIPHTRWQEAGLFLDRINEADKINGVDAFRPAPAPAPEEGIASPVSPSASLTTRILPTLFPLSTKTAAVRR